MTHLSKITSSVLLSAVLLVAPNLATAALTVGSTSITTDSTLSLQGGNVGIGELTPAAALVVGSDASATVANGTGDLYVQNDLEVGSLIIGTNFVLDNTNIRLGLGTTNPQATLDIEDVSFSTTPVVKYHQIIDVTDIGNTTTSLDYNIGSYINLSKSGSTGGTLSTRGSVIQVSSDNGGAGSSTALGQSISVSGTADTTYGLTVTVPTYATSYAATFSGGNVGIGITTPTAKLEVKDGHYASSQTTLPTESVVTYTQGTVTAGSTDTKGQFTVTTTAATGSVTLLFNIAYVSAPTCVISPASANTQVDADKTYVTTATNGLTVNYNQAPTANLQTWNYICMQ